MKKIFLLQFIFFLTTFSQVQTSNFSTMTALGPMGGQISLVRGSLDDIVIFATTNRDLLFKSTDGGESWQNVVISSSIANGRLHVNDIAFHPLNSNIIFIATDIGFFKSNDLGLTWSSGSTFRQPKYSVLFVPSNPNIILGADDSGVLKSTNGGDSWYSLMDSLSLGNKKVVKLAVHPADNDTTRFFRIFGVTTNNDSTKILWSTNGGASWKTFTKGFDSLGLFSTSISKLVVDSTGLGKNDFRIFAVTSISGIFFQSNYIDSWNKINNSDFLGDYVSDGDIIYDSLSVPIPFHSLICSNPSSPSGIPKTFTNPHGLFISPQSIYGTWRSIFSELCDINSVFIPKSASTKKIYLGTSNGIYVSTDLGTNWSQKNQGIPLAEIVHAEATSQAIVAGINGGGIVRSLDGGNNWKASNTGISSPFISTVVSDPINTNVLFAGSPLELYKSTNSGLNWFSIFAADTNKIVNKNYFTNGKNLITVVVSPVNPSFVFMHSPAFGYQISLSGGNQWTKIIPPVIDTFGLREHIQFDPVDDSTIYVSNIGLLHGLLKSTDLGNNWIDISGNIPKVIFDPISQRQIPLFALAPTINPYNSQEIYLPTLLGMDNSVPYRIFKTIDGGKNWDTVSASGYVIKIEKTDPSIVLCSGGNGIFYSSDAGKSWISVSDNKSFSGVTFFGISQKIKNIFEYYIGSGNGAHKLNLTNLPRYSADTTAGNFDSVLVGQNIERSITIQNKSGQRRLAVQFNGISDSTNFHYVGPQQFFIQPDSSISLKIKFQSKTYGSKGAILSFSTNDPLSPKVFVGLHAMVVGKIPIKNINYNFGAVLVNKDSTFSFIADNTKSFQPIELTFVRNSDSVNFNYLGSTKIFIDTGKTQLIGVRFSPKSQGAKQTSIVFSTNESLFPIIEVKFQGIGIDKFSYDFGAVLVNKDSTLSFKFDNSKSVLPIELTYIGNNDSLNFNYLGSSKILIDTGKIQSIGVQFSPKSPGFKQTTIVFSTNEPRLPIVAAKFQGVGIIKNYLSRKVVFETSFGFATHDTSTLSDYYSTLSKSLERSGISVQYLSVDKYSDLNSIVIANPTKSIGQLTIDSLQRFVINGGLLVLTGSENGSANSNLNAILNDTGWVQKSKTKTGLAFNYDVLIDSTNCEGILSGMPVLPIPYLAKVDTLATLNGGSISVDQTEAFPLFKVASKKLYSHSTIDTTIKKIDSAYIGAASKIGKGQIVVLNDYSIWWNGNEDTPSAGGILAGKNLQFALNIFGLIDNFSVKLPNPTPVEAYKIISIPYKLSDSSIVSIFKDLGPPNEFEWRMFGKWDGKSYKEFPEGFTTIQRGEGYWLITKQAKDINFGTATIPGVEEDFEMTLQPGWNLIGNPFPYKVSWARSDSSVEQYLQTYDKGWSTVSTTMDSLTGYFIKNRASTPREIIVSSKNISGNSSSLPKRESNKTYQEGEWSVQLSALSAKAKDVDNHIGMVKRALNDLDDIDVSEPPPAPEAYVSLSFKNKLGRLTADYRSISQEGAFWDFDIATSEKENKIAIQFTEFGNIPQQYRLFLIDQTVERAFDITQTLQYEFSLRKNETSRTFRIIVGTEQFVEKNTNGIPLVPLHYSLEQNFPNPFNPTTSIRYSISHSSHVELEIFNVLGQKISTLVNRFMPIGIYSIDWNGTNQIGNSVASGIYYYRLRTEEFTSVKKMMLIK